MHIGMTYSLRSEYLAAGYSDVETAEFDSDVTIDAIEQALRDLGHEPDRIGHAQQLIQRVAAGDRWDLVFNICEGLHGLSRESQVPCILDVYDIPHTFADASVLTVCLHKGLTKAVVREAGLPTPRSAVISRIEEVESVDLKYPLFAKPVAEGTGKGVSPTSRVETSTELLDECRHQLATYKQPVLVEEYLPGREFTVALLGTGDQARVLGTYEILLLDQAEPGVYSYVNKENSEELVRYELVSGDNDPEVREAERVALAAWRALNCRDGGRIDMRSDAFGQPQFMEANPLAGLHPTHSDLPMIAYATGLTYVQLLGQIVDSAAQRVGAGTRAALLQSTRAG